MSMRTQLNKSNPNHLPNEESCNSSKKQESHHENLTAYKVSQHTLQCEALVCMLIVYPFKKNTKTIRLHILVSS